MGNVVLSGDTKKLEQLKEDDKVLNQYLLEQHSKQSIFEWIRDFRDFEIREGLQKQIKELNQIIELRNAEILELQLRLDDMPKEEPSRLNKVLSSKKYDNDSYSSNHQSSLVKSDKKKL